MKKLPFLMLGLLLSQRAMAQDQETGQKQDSTKHWSIQGHNKLTLNQAAFSNWISGGTNSVGGVAGVDYTLFYLDDRNLWDNLIVMNYGLTKQKGSDTQKTQDNISLSSNYGYRFSDRWFFSGGVGFDTQFTVGYDDASDHTSDKISNFMAPAYLTTGLGLAYRPNDDFSLIMRPITAKWTFVLDPDLQKADNYGLKADGDRSLFEFGFLASSSYRIRLMKNIELVNRASVFSNYLKDPEHMVLTYSGLVNMKINDFVSANLNLDLRYDDNQIKKLQVRQLFGVGFSYRIDNGVRFKTRVQPDEYRLRIKT